MAEDLPLSPEDVEEIVSILSKSDYETLDIATARFRLQVARDSKGWTQEWRPAGGEAGPASGPARVNTETPDDGLLVITAPLPGTFYRAPQPGAPPWRLEQLSGVSSAPPALLILACWLAGLLGFWNGGCRGAMPPCRIGLFCGKTFPKVLNFREGVSIASPFLL